MILYDHKKSYQIYLYVLPRIILYIFMEIGTIFNAMYLFEIIIITLWQFT